MSNIYWCQLLKCEYLLLFFVIYDSYLDILGIYIYIIYFTFLDERRCLHEVLEIIIGIF